MDRDESDVFFFPRPQIEGREVLYLPFAEFIVAGLRGGR
jgi:hypothetical protein